MSDARLPFSKSSCCTRSSVANDVRQHTQAVPLHETARPFTMIGIRLRLPCIIFQLAVESGLANPQQPRGLQLISIQFRNGLQNRLLL
jgi:hypothetical protein